MSEAKHHDWFPPHQPNCMGCGPDNLAGLGLRMRPHGDEVVGEVTFGAPHEGAPGFAHGGAVATALDDAFGMLLMLLRRPAVTAHLEVDYRRPMFIGRRYSVRAWSESSERRKLWMAAELLEEDEIVASARALFLEVAPEHFAQADPDAVIAKKLRSGTGQLPW